MWLMAMFDLPVETREQRREYTQFRKLLLAQGFVQLQLSVYARFSGAKTAPKRSASASDPPSHPTARSGSSPSPTTNTGGWSYGSEKDVFRLSGKWREGGLR